MSLQLRPWATQRFHIFVISLRFHEQPYDEYFTLEAITLLTVVPVAGHTDEILVSNCNEYQEDKMVEFRP